MKRSLNLWLLVVAAVCALSFWFGRDLIQPASRQDNAVILPALPTAAPPADESVHLMVLNGTPEAGLARDIGLLLGRTGCVVERVGNAPHDHFVRTILVNRLLSVERAAALAAELGGLPVLREFDRRSAVDAVLVLGRDADRLREQLNGHSGS